VQQLCNQNGSHSCKHVNKATSTWWFIPYKDRPATFDVKGCKTPPPLHSVLFIRLQGSKFYGDLRNASNLELLKYYYVNCHCSTVAMPIWLSSYAAWSTSETVASVQLPLNAVFFCLAEVLSHVILWCEGSSSIDWFHGIFHYGNWKALHHHAACCLLHMIFCHPVSILRWGMLWKPSISCLWILMHYIYRKRIASSGGRLYTWRTRWGHGTSIRLVLSPAQHGFWFFFMAEWLEQLLCFQVACLPSYWPIREQQYDIICISMWASSLLIHVSLTSLLATPTGHTYLFAMNFFFCNDCTNPLISPASNARVSDSSDLLWDVGGGVFLGVHPCSEVHTAGEHHG